MITVFIGTFNRYETLERTVNSYRWMTTPHELVIVDNGTDDPRCRRLLRDLKFQKRVKCVYNLPGCNNMEEATDNFNVAIRDQFETDGQEWFAVSEADVSFENTHPDAFDVYLEVAEHMQTAVGPHLRVDAEIPTYYPLRSRVLACETWMQYRQDMQEVDGIFFNSCQTDTTFHLFPRTRFFNRLHMNPIRVGPPYDAMHLDWYLNIFEPNYENSVYIPGLRPVGSWGKAWIRDFWFAFQESPEQAYGLLLQMSVIPDLDNTSFMLSWCHQYGHGCERDLEKSKFFLKRAIPYPNEHYWPYEKNWMAMIYENDFESLGWG